MKTAQMLLQILGFSQLSIRLKKKVILEIPDKNRNVPEEESKSPLS